MKSQVVLAQERNGKHLEALKGLEMQQWSSAALRQERGRRVGSFAGKSLSKGEAVVEEVRWGGNS